MPDVTIRTIDTFEEFAALTASRIGMPSPFGSVAWQSAWCNQFLEENDCLLLKVAMIGKDLVGFAPLCVQHSLAKGSVLGFIGSGEACSDYQTLPCLPEYRDEFARALAEDLMAEGDLWDRMDLDGLGKSDPTLEAFSDWLQNLGCMVRLRPAESCWRLELAGSMDEYLAGTSKNRRKNVRRKLRQFESGEITVFEVTCDETYETGYTILRDLHQKRRTSLGEPGCFASPRFDAFLYEAGRELLHAGGLQMFWLEADQQPISAEFALCDSSGVYAYQSGISPDHMDLEPGRLANLWHIKRAIDTGRQFLDFLRGDEPYKQQLHAQPIPCCKIEVIPPKLRSLATQSVIDFGRGLRDFWSSNSPTDSIEAQGHST